MLDVKCLIFSLFRTFSG